MIDLMFVLAASDIPAGAGKTTPQRMAGNLIDVLPAATNVVTRPGDPFQYVTVSAAPFADLAEAKNRLLTRSFTPSGTVEEKCSVYINTTSASMTWQTLQLYMRGYQG